MKFRGMHKGHGQLVNSESTGSLGAAPRAQDYQNIEGESKGDSAKEGKGMAYVEPSICFITFMTSKHLINSSVFFYIEFSLSVDCNWT